MLLASAQVPSHCKFHQEFCLVKPPVRSHYPLATEAATTVLWGLPCCPTDTLTNVPCAMYMALESLGAACSPHKPFIFPTVHPQLSSPGHNGFVSRMASSSMDSSACVYIWGAKSCHSRPSVPSPLVSPSQRIDTSLNKEQLFGKLSRSRYYLSSRTGLSFLLPIIRRVGPL